LRVWVWGVRLKVLGLGYRVLYIDRTSGKQAEATILKWTCRRCGTNPSTLERETALEESGLHVVKASGAMSNGSNSHPRKHLIT